MLYVIYIDTIDFPLENLLQISGTITFIAGTKELLLIKTADFNYTSASAFITGTFASLTKITFILPKCFCITGSYLAKELRVCGHCSK